MTITREAVLSKAAGWIGMTERTGNNDIWFADDWGITGYSWCYAFVQSCFYYAGEQLPYVTLYVPSGVVWSRDNGQSIEVGAGDPAPGDIVHFTWGGGYGRWTPGTGDHVGLVEGWDGSTVYTIEGNTSPGDGVWRKARSVGNIINFWRPSTYGGSVVTPPPPTPSDGIPDGSNVSFMQGFLNNNNGAGLDVDGDYGPLTTQAVYNWQARIFPSESSQWDGDWGPMTTQRTREYMAGSNPAPAPSPSPAPSPPPSGGGGPAWPGVYLVNYTAGNGVSTWQAQMAARGWSIDVDDQYGPGSAQVCTSFQQEKGLEVDGVVGPQTWSAAWNAPVI